MTNFNGHPSNVVPAIAQLIDLMEQHFPALSVSSTTDGTHATNSYHYRGEAVDLVADSGTMYTAAAWVTSSGLYHTLLEGIHNPNLSVDNGQQVSPSVWGALTWSEHTSHIHLAASTLSGVNLAGLPPVAAGVPTAPSAGSVDFSPMQDAIINSSMYGQIGPGSTKAQERAHHGYVVSRDTRDRFNALTTFDKHGGH